MKRTENTIKARKRGAIDEEGFHSRILEFDERDYCLTYEQNELCNNATQSPKLLITKAINIFSKFLGKIHVRKVDMILPKLAQKSFNVEKRKKQEIK